MVSGLQEHVEVSECSVMESIWPWSLMAVSVVEVGVHAPMNT